MTTQTVLCVTIKSMMPQQLESQEIPLNDTRSSNSEVKNFSDFHNVKSLVVEFLNQDLVISYKNTGQCNWKRACFHLEAS